MDISEAVPYFTTHDVPKRYGKNGPQMTVVDAGTVITLSIPEPELPHSSALLVNVTVRAAIAPFTITIIVRIVLLIGTISPLAPALVMVIACPVVVRLGCIAV